jgi:hypothetical protein
MRSLDNIGISPAMVARLQSSGVSTLAHLRELSDEQLQAIPGIGPMRGRDIRIAQQYADGMDAIDWQTKFDALIAAVMELDDAQRDRILQRAKELEAESPDGDDE